MIRYRGDERPYGDWNIYPNDPISRKQTASGGKRTILQKLDEHANTSLIGASLAKDAAAEIRRLWKALRKAQADVGPCRRKHLEKT